MHCELLGEVMNFTINGQTADITLETEETVGELLAGLEQWLADSDFSLSGIEIDGKEIASGDISGLFSQKLDSINAIDVKTSSNLELYLEALIRVRDYLEIFTDASFEDKKVVQKTWTDGAAASFIKHRETAFFAMLNDVFSGEGIHPAQAHAIVMERIRELENSAAEIEHMRQFIEDCAVRLEDLPLDLQTGKDLRAAETIQLFSGLAEKLFRIIAIMEQQGVNFEVIQVEDRPFEVFIKEFNTALDELLSAYESKDSVLVGDLAEYELAPRLRGFYVSINNPLLQSGGAL